MEVGFGKASLWDAFETTMRLADSIDVRAMAVRGSGITSIVFSVDLGNIPRLIQQELSQKVAAALGLPIEHIGVYATHNHSAPGPIKNEELRLKAFIAAGKEALAKLQPAEMAHVCVHPDPPLNFCRRVRIDGIGTFTCWYGHRALENGRADVAHFVKNSMVNFREGNPEQLRGYTARTPNDFDVPDAPVFVPTPLIPEAAKEDALHGLFFRTLDGKSIGSIISFPTHPVTTNPKVRDFGSGDYPVYVTRRTEKIFGGVGMFIAGACGDSCPVVPRKSLEFAEQLGTRIADNALNALRSARWSRPERIAVSSPRVRMKLHEKYPTRMADAEKTIGVLREQFSQRAARGADMGELKRLSDEIEFYARYVDKTFYKWSNVPLEEMKGAEFDQPLFVLRLGDVALAGMPGEPFNAYSTRLRRETIGENLILGEQCNGSVGYLPTADEFKHGSYESVSSLFDEGVEDVLIDGIKDGMKRVGFIGALSPLPCTQGRGTG